jgi:hypothetical protein
MAYSDSKHFSDKISYKILCISSYSLKDINFARFDKLQEFSETETKLGLFAPKRIRPRSLAGGARGGWGALTGPWDANNAPAEADNGVHLSDTKLNQKGVALCPAGESNSRSTGAGQRTRTNTPVKWI